MSGSDDAAHTAVEPSAALILEGEDGFGQQLRVDFNRKLGKSLFRFRNELSHFEQEDEAELFEELSLTLPSGHRAYTAFAASFLAPGDRDDPQRYRGSFRYRRQFWRKWLFGELEPGVEFPEDEDYEPLPFITVRLDVYFDRAGI